MTEVIGDMAYVSDNNLKTCGEEIALIAKTNPAVAAAKQTEDWRKVSALIKMPECFAMSGRGTLQRG